MKILVLFMTCNKPLYEEEEKACRETFLKDVDESKVSYWFYKGVNDEHPTQEFDNETHTLYLDVPDTLAGTGRKTLEAIRATLSTEYDYLIKTNVSSYLNFPKIVEEFEKWPGADDENIYGSRFILNDASKSIPFPRGYFMVIPKHQVEGMIEVADKLIGKKGIPVTDDTLIGLSVLYNIVKIKGDTYLDKLCEVPSVVEWPKYDIEQAPEFFDSLVIRCKSEGEDGTNTTPDNIRLVHKRLKNPTNITRCRPPKMFETPLGMLTYERYFTLRKIVTAILKQTKKNEDTDV